MSTAPDFALEPMLAGPLEYKLAGHVLRVVAAYTNQTCSAWELADKKNRNGRVFLCLSCWYPAHADRNAARSIKDVRICNISRPARHGRLAPRTRHTIFDFPVTSARSARVKGCLDAKETRCTPARYQTQTNVWSLLGPPYSKMTCNVCRYHRTRLQQNKSV